MENCVVLNSQLQSSHKKKKLHFSLTPTLGTTITQHPFIITLAYLIKTIISRSIGSHFSVQPLSSWPTDRPARKAWRYG